MAPDRLHDHPGDRISARFGRRISTVAQIVDKLNTAILERRLLPGTKLAEERLSGIFAVSRTRIREALTRLANQHVVEIVPYHGAYVSKPTVEEASDIFEARRLIEPFSVHKIVARPNPFAAHRLRDHLAQEQSARERHDAPGIIRLSGEFHILLTELAGNAALLLTMRELAARTCLIISQYGQSTALSCRADEHTQIVDAVTDRDDDRAIQLLLGHLDHIRDSLDLARGELETNLEEVLS